MCVAQVTEISMGEFIVHGSALWLNPMTSLGRMRKEPELTIFSEYDSRPCMERKYILIFFPHTNFSVLKSTKEWGRQ